MIKAERQVVILWLLTAILLVNTAWADRFYWDVSHTPFEDYHPDGEYNQLISLLEQNGFTQVEGNESIIEQGLWDVDILVISILSNYEDHYTFEEVERIVSFVNGGGGLIVLGDNSVSNPENIAPVLEPFHMLSAQGDDLENPDNLMDHLLFQGVASIAFHNGGAVEGDEQDGAFVIARDNNGLGGIVFKENLRGSVLLFGDADFWTNGMLNQLSNSLLAMNSFNLSDRTREGRINVNDQHVRVFLPSGYSTVQSINILNVGEAALEVGFDLDGEEDWIGLDANYLVLDALGEANINISLDTEALPADTVVTDNLVINHNDPTRGSIAIDISLYVFPSEPAHFEVPGPTGQDHSLLIRELTIEGEPADPGIEIGVFTPNGTCAGGAVYMGEMLGIAARADDPFTEQVDGFLPQEPLRFRIYTPWSEIESGTSPNYEAGPDLFTMDALSVLTLDGRNDAIQQINLNQRWNLISLNITPPELDPTAILAPLVEDNLLVMIKDDNGRFWDLRTGFSNLHAWNITKGYQVMIRQPFLFEVNGLEIPINTSIILEFGWSIIPYFPRESQPVETALESIRDNLRLLKRDDGAFYFPRWGWDGIGTLEPGEGYKAALTAPDTLVYSRDVERIDQQVSGPGDFTPSSSGLDMSLLLLDIDPGKRVRIISPESVIAGEGVAGNDLRAGVPVWGDDPATDPIEGLFEGQPFMVHISKNGSWAEAEIDWLNGEPVYSTDDIAVGSLRKAAYQPFDMELTCYPNPFNDRFTVSFNTIAGEKAELVVYDLNGRALDRQVSAPVENDSRSTLTCSSEDWPAGTVLIKLTSSSGSRTVKALHLP